MNTAIVELARKILIETGDIWPWEEVSAIKLYKLITLLEEAFNEHDRRQMERN